MSSEDPTASLHAAAQHAAELIAQADALVIAAGAGMGVDSGLPDFRGNAGFWNAYPALGREGMAFYEVASPSTFSSRPRLAWGFYGHRLALYRATLPHAGFAMLKRWGEQMLHGSFVYTSNVDGQFQRAGFEENASWSATDRSINCSACSRAVTTSGRPMRWCLRSTRNAASCAACCRTARTALAWRDPTS